MFMLPTLQRRPERPGHPLPGQDQVHGDQGHRARGHRLRVQDAGLPAHRLARPLHRREPGQCRPRRGGQRAQRQVYQGMW